MEIGGWKTRSVFDRYNIVSERDLHEAVRRLDKYVSERNGNLDGDNLVTSAGLKDRQSIQEPAKLLN